METKLPEQLRVFEAFVNEDEEYPLVCLGVYEGWVVVWTCWHGAITTCQPQLTVMLSGVGSRKPCCLLLPIQLYDMALPLSHSFHTERLIRIETQINLLDMNPGSRPCCKVVLNLHSPVNPGLIAYFDFFTVLSKWQLRVNCQLGWCRN